MKKSYANLKRIHKEFNIRDHVILRFKPKKSSLKLGIYAKLFPRYCGPFEIFDRIRMGAYRIALPTSIISHNVFHVLFLKGYVHDPNHIIDWNLISVK